MAEYGGPILVNDGTLLISRPRNRTDNVHAPSRGPRTGDKRSAAHGLVAGGGGDFHRSDLKIRESVRQDLLKENKDTVVSGAEFVGGPTGGTLFGKANAVLVALLDGSGSAQQRLFGTGLGRARQIAAGRPLQSQVVPGGACPTGSAVDNGKVGRQGIAWRIKGLNGGIRAIVVPCTDGPIIVIGRIERGKGDRKILLNNFILVGRPNVDNHQEQNEGVH